MEYSSLKNTKKSLTVIFTLLVFAIAVLLEFVFFTAKYYNYTFSEKKVFDTVTSRVENKYVSLNDFISTYDIWKKLFKMTWKDRENLETSEKDLQVNIIIIEKEKRELVFSNVVDDISLEFVQEALLYDYSSIKQKQWYFIKKIFVVEWEKDYDVLFIKSLRYNFWDYLTDLLGFIFITFFFSIFFYIIWLKFVSTTLEPVEDNIKDMQDFIHNAGHELKTPISIIHSNLQIIKETKQFEVELIQEWLTEVNRLDHLIESLVELSNINSTENKTKLDIEEDIKMIINDFKVESNNKDIKIILENKWTKPLIVNKQYFYILFSNLIWNAIKYSWMGWKVTITLEKDKIIVKDNWIWIKKKYLNKIFDRFYMVDTSRNSNWHWIWLSLVKKIIDIYNWNIRIKSKYGEWSEFIVEF